MSPDKYTIAVDTLIFQLKHHERSHANDTHSVSGAPALNLLSLSAATPTISHGRTRLELANEYEVKNNYKLNYFVFVDGQKLGYVSLHHLRPIVDAELLSFTVANAILYTDYVPKLATLFADLELEVANVTRIDIAVDTPVNLLDRFTEYFKQPDDYYYLYRATDAQNVGIPFAGVQYRTGEQSVTLTPQIAADKRLRIYNKTDELKKSGKQYITDYHRANGLDTSQPVYWVELSLSNTAFKTKETTFSRLDTATGELLTLSNYEYVNLSPAQQQTFTQNPPTRYDNTPDYTRLGDGAYLLSLFNIYSRSLRIFSRKDNKNKSRCTPVYLLRLGDAKPLVPIVTQADSLKYKKQMTTTFKTLVRNYYTTNNPLYLTTAEQLAKDHNEQDELQKQLSRLLPYRSQYQKPTPRPGAVLPL